VSFLRTIVPFARATILACLIAASGGGRVAHAASEQRTLKQMVQLNKRALAAHAAGRQQTAKKLLLDALTLGEASGLGSHLMSARTNIHLGVVSIVGLKQREEGLAFFAQAMKIRPGIKLTPRLATPALMAAFEQARRTKPAAPQPPVARAVTPAAPPSTAKPKEGAELAAGDLEALSKDEEPDVPATIPQPLYCPTPMEGPPGEEVSLLCLTDSDIPVNRVVAYYRPSTVDTYFTLPMTRSQKGWYSAVIPRERVAGRSLQFYFEAQSDNDYVAHRNGKEESPNIMVLKAGAAPVGVGALAALHARAVSDESPQAEQSPIELRGTKETPAEKQARARRRPVGSIWVGLGLGTGWGWHGRRPLERHPGRSVTTGNSSVGLGHLVPEIGWQMTPELSLSLQSRHQYLPRSGAGDAQSTGAPPRSAHAVLARVQYVALSFGGLDLLGTGGLGGGSALRLKIEPAPERGLVASDTVVIGPIVGSVGVGAAYNFSSRWVALAEARTLIAAWNPGVLVELNAGVQLGF
jgi:hypothetical protein